MRTIGLALLVLGSLGCTHMTTHDYCVANADHYASYNECYQEQTARSERMRNSFSKMTMAGADAHSGCTCP